MVSLSSSLGSPTFSSTSSLSKNQTKFKVTRNLCFERGKRSSNISCSFNEFPGNLDHQKNGFSGDLLQFQIGKVNEGRKRTIGVLEPPWEALQVFPTGSPSWVGLEMKMNSVELPVSLRMIKLKKKKKKEKQLGLFSNGWSENSSCSVETALSALIFMVGEVQRYAMRAEDFSGYLTEILDGSEMDDSFVWLFQQIFSCTPTLMVNLVVLLADFIVYSAGIVDFSGGSEAFPEGALKNGRERRSSVKSLLDFTSDGDSRVSGLLTGSAGGTDSTEVPKYVRFPANKVTNPALTVEKQTEYDRTGRAYQKAIAEDPENSLLLSNYAQFLYQIIKDHNRAEDYFVRAMRVKPVDAEAANRYGMFLWMAREDVEAAEEAFLAAIEAEPGNTHYISSYSRFLWLSGAPDTCFPLDTPPRS